MTRDPDAITRRTPPGAARVRRYAALVVINAIGAFCYVGIKLGLRYASPLVFGGARSLIGGTVLLAVAAAVRQQVVPSRSDLGPLVILGLVATTATYGAMFGSPALMDAGLASVLGNVQPLMTVALGVAVLHEPLTARKLFALTAGLAGAVLIASPAFRGSPGAPGLGAALALIASAGAAGGSILFKRARLSTGLIATTGWQLVLGSLPLLAAAVLLDAPAPNRWPALFSGILLGLALLGTALPMVLWFWLLQNEDAGTLSLFLFLTPVLALGVDVAWVGGSVNAPQSLGVLLIFGGLFALARWPQQSSRAGAVAALARERGVRL